MGIVDIWRDIVHTSYRGKIEMKEANAKSTGNSCGSSTAQEPDVGRTKDWEKPVVIDGYSETVEGCGEGNYYVKCDSGDHGGL